MEDLLQTQSIDQLAKASGVSCSSIILVLKTYFPGTKFNEYRNKMSQCLIDDPHLLFNIYFTECTF